MEIWMYEYAYDMFFDGRMDEDVQLFSTKENAFKYAEINGKHESEFSGDDENGYYAENDVGKYDSETYYIHKIKLDEALEMEGDK